MIKNRSMTRPASHDLPIEELRDSVVEALRDGNRLVVEAPTGSGKSTRIPQMLLDGGILGDGQAVILQPRRCLLYTSDAADE